MPARTGPPDPAPNAVAARRWSPDRSCRRPGRRSNQLGHRAPAWNDGPLRPLIALHGKGSDAATVMAGGVEQGLAQAVNAGLPAFAVVAVDGGGSYWHHRTSGEDSGAMVLNELIPMLGDQGLDTSRVGFIGWSMGGYEPFCSVHGWARSAQPRSARSARLCGCRQGRGPRAFDSADDFAANTVFGLPALGSIPIRIDCGTSDPFYSATTQFVAQLPTPPAGGFPWWTRRRILEFAASGRTDLDRPASTA